MKFAAIVCAASILALTAGSSRADVSVRVDTPVPSSERFLVVVSTRHADFHNGYSRERFRGLVPANVRTRVPIDFYVSLVGHGVYAYHPDYHIESAVTHSRGDELPALTARRWDSLLENAKSLPVYAVSGSPEGPSYFRLLHHVEGYGKLFLPALDRAGVEPDSTVLARFAALLARADAIAVAATDLDRRGQTQLKEQRERVLPELEKLLTLTGAQRLAIADFREATIGPKPIVAALQKDAGYPALLAFVASTHADAAGRLPRLHRWDNSTGVQLTYRLVEWHRPQIEGHARACARGQLVVDARPIAKGVFPDLVRQVDNVDFCRDASGRWVLETRVAFQRQTVERWVDSLGTGGATR